MSKIQFIITTVLQANLNNKMIIYKNTAICADNIKESIDAFLDSTPDFQGNTIIIHGDMYSDIKFLSSVNVPHQK